MGEKTGIAWCQHTWSPWLGCTKLESPDPAGSACDHCYAASWAKRAGKPELWNGKRRRTTDRYWRQLGRWNAAAAAAGIPATVFPSLCDPFDNQAEPEWREAMWERIRACPWLTFLLLTKRPQNIRKMLPPDWGPGYPNVWLGATAENQTELNRRMGHLRIAPAVVRFLSCEPLLGPLDLEKVECPRGCVPPDYCNYCHPDGNWATGTYDALAQGDVGWVIVGGESGGGARPMQLQWAMDLLTQCYRVGVPSFFKQVGSNRGSDWTGDIRGKGDEVEDWPEPLMRAQAMPDLHTPVKMTA